MRTPRRLRPRLQSLEPRRLLAVDLVASVTEYPAELLAGTPTSFTVEVENLGDETAVDARVQVEADGLQQQRWTRYTHLPKQINLDEFRAHPGVQIAARSTHPSIEIVTKLVGDLNGDGFDDMSVQTNEEWQLLFGGPDFGRSGAVVVNAEGSHRILHVPRANAELPLVSATGLGDVNGDGIDDVALADKTTAYIIFGRTGLEQLDELNITDSTRGYTVGPLSGYRPQGAPLGDVNADGIGDFALTWTTEVRQTAVIFGSATPEPIDVSNLGARGFMAGNRVSSLAAGGDFNGDGIADLVISDQTKTPSTFVLLGGPDIAAAPELNGEFPFPPPAADEAQFEPFHISSVGDTNGDGMDDFLLMDLANGFSYYLIRGAADIASRPLTPQRVQDDARAEIFRGLDCDCANLKPIVQGVGDVDSDGFADFLMGQWLIRGHRDLGTGKEHTHDSLASNPHATWLWRDYSEDDFGLAAELSRGGDVNGDGATDFVVSAISSGVSYLVFGTSPLAGTGPIDDRLEVPAGARLEYRITGEVAAEASELTIEAQADTCSEASGQHDVEWSVRPIGEPPADGKHTYEIQLQNHDPQHPAKVTVATDSTVLRDATWQYQAEFPVVDLTDLRPHDGVVHRIGTYSQPTRARTGIGDINGDGRDDYVFSRYGSAGGQVIIYSGTTNAVLHAFDTDATPPSIEDVGDLNGDGFDDIIFGSGGRYTASILLGAPDLESAAVINIGHTYGWWNAAPGDFNGDGFDDLVMNTQAGTTILFGHANIQDKSVWQVDFLHPESHGLFLPHQSRISAASLAGDFNGDGVDDLVLGRSDTGGFVLYGNTNYGSPDTIDLNDLPPGAGFAYRGVASMHDSVAIVGDLNGDGAYELVLAAKETEGFAEELPDGRVTNYLLIGGQHWPTSGEVDVSALMPEHAVRLYSDRPLMVSDLGDHNGDGLDDLFVAEKVEWPDTRPGSAFIVFGRTDIGDAVEIEMSELTGAFGFELTKPLGRVGRVIGNAGDVNADGVSDIIVSGDHHRLDGGESYVLYGRDVHDTGVGPIDQQFQLGAGRSANIIIQGTPDGDTPTPDTPPSLDVQITATRCPGQTDVDSSNNTSSNTIPVGPRADLNQDGRIDFADFLVLSANYGRDDDVKRQDGDLDEDGRVAFADFLILRRQYGR